MRPTSLSTLTLTLTLTFALPLSTLAAPIKGIRKPTHAESGAVRYASSSSRKSASSSSSTPYMATHRMKDTGMVFKAPQNWEARYVLSAVYLSLNHNQFLPNHTTYIGVDRVPLSKGQTLKTLYRTLLQNSTVETAYNYEPNAPDHFVPSFRLTGSGMIKAAGMDALSVTFTGEYASTPHVYRRVMIVKDKWLYRVWLNTLPPYAEADGKVFEGVVGSVGFGEGTGLSVSSASSKGRRGR